MTPVLDRLIEALINAACESLPGSDEWLVVADRLEEIGDARSDWTRIHYGGNGGNGEDDGYGDGGGGYGGGYGGYGGEGGGGGDGDGGSGDGGGGDGREGFGGDGSLKTQPKELEMQNGQLVIISQPSGYYPYVHVGWLKHVGGFEWELHGARIIRRFGNNIAITTLAVKGPQNGTELLPKSEEPESIFRPNVTRCIPANVEAWAKDCPCPFYLSQTD